MNKYNYELNLEKNHKLSQKVLAFKGDSKKLYNCVTDLTGEKS